MFIRKLKDCTEIVAGDGTLLRELLHPDREYPFGGRYSLAHAVVDPGKRSKPHRLTTSEVYYILSGRGRMYIDDDSAEVEAGDAFEIPAGSTQWLENDGDEPVVFLCIVDPAWQPHQESVDQ